MTTAADVVAFLQGAGPPLLAGNRQLIQQLELRLSDSDFMGLALTAPAQVRTDTDKALPVVLAVQKTVLRGWEVMEQENLALALMDLDTGELRIERLLVDRKADERGEPVERSPRPSAEAGKALVTKLYHVDARERLPVPWRQASLAVSAVAFDWVSNAARIELSGNVARPRPRPAAISPRPAQPGGLPVFERSPRHPAPPAKGVAFKIEPATGGTFIILGAFTKPASAGDILPTLQPLPTANGTQSAIAAARMTLAVIGLDRRTPGVAAWGLPVFGTNVAVPGQPLQGYFAIDLRSAGVLQGPGAYAAYIFMDADVYGPQRFEVPR
ncbi:MAG: hypothetical protein IT531_15255 [Burkholderiales bacterium]|nr:hypothetical protein [Burkholderiales bacterium]